jgi:hypothetical protein
VIAGPGEGIREPAAVAVSADGKRAVVASGADAPAVVLDLESRSAAPVACGCKATEAEPMAGNAVFRLTADSEPVMWVLEAGGPHPRLLFVPAAKAREGPK